MASEETENDQAVLSSSPVNGEDGGGVLMPGAAPKKRAVTEATVKKWIMMYDDSLETSSWMKYEKSDEFHVSRLKCSICQLFEDELRKYTRNFSSAFIEGSENLRTSGFQDHARSDMHKRAMSYWKMGQIQFGVRSAGSFERIEEGKDKIMSCEMYSTGLGAKRKIKLPSQGKDIPNGGHPKYKRAKTTKELVAGVQQFIELGHDGFSNGKGSFRDRFMPGGIGMTCRETVGQDLSIMPEAIQIRTEEWVEELQPVMMNSSGNNGVSRETGGIDLGQKIPQRPLDQTSTGNMSLDNNGGDRGVAVEVVPVLYVGNPIDGGEVEQDQEECQPPAVVDSCSDQIASPPVEEERSSCANDTPVADGVFGEVEDASIYKLLFNLPSVPSPTFPSVVEAVHLGMKETTNLSQCLELSESILRQILSLDSDHCVAIAPCLTSAYCLSVFAAMVMQDPISACRQVSLANPFVVVHDTFCNADFHRRCSHGFTSRSTSESAGPGPLKTATSLTGCCDWNLGDAAHPMDWDGLRMALKSNRVAAVFYQPYGYSNRIRHLSLADVASACHLRDSSQSSVAVTVIVDATAMPAQSLSTGNTLVSEITRFIDQGADLVLMPSLQRLGGLMRSSILVGKASHLGSLRENIAELQSRVCIPLTCLPHEVVATVVTYKALQESC